MPGTMASWASPYTSGLASTTGRIEFVNLRTDCSLPVALHPFLRKRSYFPLIGSDQPMQGLAPCQSNTIKGALVSAFQAFSAQVGSRPWLDEPRQSLCQPSRLAKPRPRLDERWLPPAYPDNLFASKALRGWHLLASRPNHPKNGRIPATPRWKLRQPIHLVFHAWQNAR